MLTAIIPWPHSISPSRVRCSAHSQQILKTRTGNPPKTLYPIYWTKQNTLHTTEICSCTSNTASSSPNSPHCIIYLETVAETVGLMSSGVQVPTSNRTWQSCREMPPLERMEQVRQGVNIRLIADPHKLTKAVSKVSFRQS